MDISKSSFLSYLSYLSFLVFKIKNIPSPNKMINFKDNVSSESFYPDSNFYLDKENTEKVTSLPEDQLLNMGRNFEWPNSYWFIAERTNGRLAMIGLMAAIINYGLFGWIAPGIL